MYEISKDEFVKMIDAIQRHIEYDSACDYLARKYQIDLILMKLPGWVILQWIY